METVEVEEDIQRRKQELEMHGTVDKHWLNVGGTTLLMRGKAPDRSFARVEVVMTSLPHKPIQVLQLVLKRKPFEVMRSGEKTEEFRDNTPYWRSRMLDAATRRWRDFDWVEFSLGFHPTRQKFRARFLGITLVSAVDRKYSNGLHVDCPFKRRQYIMIHLGKIL